MTLTLERDTDEKQRLVRLARAQRKLFIKEERERQSSTCGGLLHFVRYFWKILEPNEPFKESWPLYAICDHLEAVSRGEITRLLMNVPPGFMKSLMTDVFWPAWEWSALGKPHMRYVTFAYASSLTERDNGRMLMLIRSQAFQEMWGHAFGLVGQGVEKLSNDKTGWKIASSVRGVGTGERGNRVVVDDPHNVKDGESEAIRSETVRWFRESLSDRFNNMQEGVLIVIMQRVHEDDVSGSIIENSRNYCHLMIPMEYDSTRHCTTEIGWTDPRTEDGQLAWPDRFPPKVVSDLKADKGPYAYVGQYQQSPEPRGGGIFKRDWWRLYEVDDETRRPKYPPYYVVASLDPAYSAKQENDPSGFVVYGVFKDGEGRKKITLLYAWQKRLDLHGPDVERKSGESESAYVNRSKPSWGLVEWVGYDCKRLKVDMLLIESKASGLSVFQEIRRLYRDEPWAVQTIDPKGLDKRTRAIAVQHLFSDGLIYAPDRDWADMVISEHAKFRGLDSDKDNLVDASTQALKWLRDNGVAVRREEQALAEREAAQYKKPASPLYDV